MAIAWYICQYKIRTYPIKQPDRYCAMDDFTTQINAASGAWAESEILGGYAVVKVRANSATLTTIGNTTGFTRLPTFATLDTVMTSLTTGQRNTLVTLIDNMGYTPAELSAALGSNLAAWRTKTLRQVLIFVAQRRLKPRWDDVQSQIVLDGILQACTPIADVDAEVT